MLIKKLKRIYGVLISPVERLYFAKRHSFPIIRHLKYSGVYVPETKKIFDTFFPKTRMLHDRDEYESAIVDALKNVVKQKDKVVIVGGGFGVTACIAAQLCGTRGSVICYEGNQSSVNLVRETAILNGVSDIVEVVCAIVAVDIGVYEGEKSKEIVSPDHLPECNVLQLDCEGAEIPILANMYKLPEKIIVETHGYLGAPTVTVYAILEELGYNVKDLGVAEKESEKFCLDNDVRCLLAEKG